MNKKFLKKIIAIFSAGCVFSFMMMPLSAATVTDEAYLGTTGVKASLSATDTVASAGTLAPYGGAKALSVSMTYYYYNRSTKTAGSGTKTATSASTMATVSAKVPDNCRCMDAVSYHTASTANQNWNCYLSVEN